MTAMVQVRNRHRSYFFSEFIELEFYFFRKYDPISGIIRNFDTFFSFFIKSRISTEKPVNAFECFHREFRVLMDSPCKVRNLVTALSIHFLLRFYLTTGISSSNSWSRESRVCCIGRRGSCKSIPSNQR